MRISEAKQHGCWDGAYQNAWELLGNRFGFSVSVEDSGPEDWDEAEDATGLDSEALEDKVEHEAANQVEDIVDAGECYCCGDI